MNAIPWRWVLLGVALSLLLAAITGWLWLDSTTDLTAFAAEAKAAGVALDPVVTDPVADAWWAARGRELAGIPYYSDTGQDLPMDFAKVLDPRFDQVGAWAAQAPPGRIASKNVPSGLDSWFRLRLVLAPINEVAGLIHRLRQNVEVISSRSDSTWLEAITQVRGVPECLISRRGQLSAADCEAIAGDLAVIAQAMEEQVRQSGAGILRGSYAASQRHELCRSLGIRLPGIYESAFGVLVLERSGRRQLLAGVMAWHESMSRCPDVQAMVQAIRLRRAEWEAMPKKPWPTSYLRQQANLTSFYRYQVERVLAIRLLAADLAGRPWPDDPFAPPGTPLHRVERDGALLGAWSVGDNGLPDGGNRRNDLCMGLSGEKLGRPDMGDALPPSELPIQGPPLPEPSSLPPSPPGPLHRPRIRRVVDE